MTEPLSLYGGQILEITEAPPTWRGFFANVILITNIFAQCILCIEVECKHKRNLGMDKFDKLYRLIVIDGKTDIRFSDLEYFVEHLGFQKRMRGDHNIYTIDGLPDIINIQDNNGKAKIYQVRQVRSIVRKNKMGRDSNE